MSNIDWLLRESTDETVLKLSTMNRFDDDNWRGVIERIWVGSGLHLTLSDLVINRDMTLNARTERQDSFLYHQITLKGMAEVDLLDGPKTVTSMDRSFIVRSTQAGSAFSFREGTRYLASGFDLDLDRIERLFDGDPPAVLHPLLARDIDRSMVLPVRATALIRTIGASLFAPDLHGPLRTIMQEGAVLQLLAILVASAGNATTAGRPEEIAPPLERPSDRDAVLHARDRLLANIATPPTLTDLSASVNMTEKKLNAGFKSLFGTTVYETLRNERLEHARLVLESGDLSVKEVAYRVGYNHVSNFITAFKSRYGTSPRRYLIEARDDRHDPPSSSLPSSPSSSR